MCQQNGSVNANQTRTSYAHSESNHHDPPQSDTTYLFQDGSMAMQKVQTLGHTNAEHTDVPFYDNRGFLPDDQRHNDGDVANAHSTGSGSFTEDDSGNC